MPNNDTKFLSGFNYDGVEFELCDSYIRNNIIDFSKNGYISTINRESISDTNKMNARKNIDAFSISRYTVDVTFSYNSSTKISTGTVIVPHAHVRASFIYSLSIIDKVRYPYAIINSESTSSDVITFKCLNQKISDTLQFEIIVFKQ